jgi:hypothetical protein
VLHQFLNVIDIPVKTNRKFRIEILNISLIDEDSELLNDVTSRMAMDNIKTNRTTNDSRTRGEIKLMKKLF